MDLRRIMTDEPGADGPSANYHDDPSAFYDTDYTSEYATQSEKVPHAMILKPARFDPEESVSNGQMRRPSPTTPSTPKAEFSELQFHRANSEPFDDGDLDPPRPSVKFYRNTSAQHSVSAHSRTCTPPERNDTPEAAPTQDWMECVESHGGKKFTCHWDICGYTAGRQLVKRHVESVHLHLRPHTCPHCPASFPQKANLAVHISCQHEKTRPFKCNDPKVVGGDPTCTRDFNDRAALHRHKIAAHGYVPKATKRSEKFGKKGSAVHESLPPWATDE
ncbi:hypothetical protein CYLTODRAFT_123758 [Cylindrobasidium torrendii FP15055 ss-10]|uniref:C2H2-type domain-containing protein n=1 Tax=Cylindrobasidium torrendii FP15055 ss-10 TaxID=1314674 RepID=A0A0D7BLN7_9AGAR|nr:hypothetical protein CYLTODRAFT_123758 [Cylindrobasidium torrendii FP15055 ss-10]